MITVVALGGLGAMLARTIFGSPLVWGAGLFIGGIVLVAVGTKLDLVG